MAQPADGAFATTWETTTNGESITIPTDGNVEGFDVSKYDFTIDWGDGTVEEIAGDDPDPSHQYSSAGTYQVEITTSQAGEAFPLFSLGAGSSENAQRLQSIDQWGSIQWESMAFAFAGAENMVYRAADEPILTNVTNMRSMFRNTTLFNGDIGSWDVSSVTDMRRMFSGATSFNKAVDGWNVSNVTTMDGMFEGAIDFNQPVGSWDVSSVTDMQELFREATSFNKELNQWDVSNVTDMDRMFAVATSFNQDLSSWDVSNVSDMASMFENATSFNQDLGSWDVSSVKDDGCGGVFENMLDNSGLSPDNYDQTVIGWSRLDLSFDVTLGADGLAYCDAGPFREYLQSEFGWGFNDEGQANTCPTDLTASGSASVDSEGSITFTGGTSIVFSGGFGQVTLGRFSSAPQDAGSISEANVSEYRVVVAASPDLLDSGQHEVRFRTSAFPGIEQPSAVVVYRRPLSGSGEFEALQTFYDSSTGEIVAETASFGELIFASNNDPLPVELAGFEGSMVDKGSNRPEGTSVRLEWQTASETGNAGFEVQRQAEDGAWNQVGFRESQAEGGTTNEALSYRFTDRAVPYAADSLRYRLRQVDVDGTAVLSEPITIARSGPDRLRLLGTAPNPTRRRATVRYAVPETGSGSEEVRLRLYDVLGRQVRSVSATSEPGRHERHLKVDGLPSGTYLLRLSAGGETATRKITVVR
jgi:surface protein